MPPLAMQTVPSEGPAIPAGRAQSRIAPSHFESCFYSGSKSDRLEFSVLPKFCPKNTVQPSSTMATSLAAGRPPGPRARPPRRPRHQAPPRGRAGTRAAPWRHLPGQNNKDQNQDQNPQNRIRTKIATRTRTRKPKTSRGPRRGGGVPAGWPHQHGAKKSARRRFNPSPPSEALTCCEATALCW